MTELCCEYLSVQCIWLYVLIMPRTCFRVNPHSIVSWMSRNSLLEGGTKSELSHMNYNMWTITYFPKGKKHTLIKFRDKFSFFGHLMYFITVSSNEWVSLIMETSFKIILLFYILLLSLHLERICRGWFSEFLNLISNKRIWRNRTGGKKFWLHIYHESFHWVWFLSFEKKRFFVGVF